MLSNQRFFLFILCSVLLFIAVKSQYPLGYMYAHGDLAYLFTNYPNKAVWFSDTFSDYDKGGLNHIYVSAYYYFFDQLQEIVGTEYISVLYSSFFLFGSFFSFVISTRIFLNGQSHVSRNSLIMYSISFLYAVNAYTAYGRYSLPSPFYSLYIIIPLLFSTLHSYFVEKSIFNRKILYCAIVLLVSNFVWVNPSYFVAYVLLSLTYVLVLSYLYRQGDVKKLIKKTILFYFVVLSSCSILILPVAPILIGHTQTSEFSAYSDALIKWLSSQAVSMEKVFSLGEKGLNNLPQLNYSLLTFAACMIFIMYGFVLIIGVKSNRRITALFSVLLIVIILLLNKGKGTPLESATFSFFSSNPLLASLRSYDKVLIFLPFFLLFPIFLYCNSVRNIWMPLAAVVISLGCLYPFLNGDLYKRYYRVESGSSYLDSAYSSLVKIPQEYFDVTSMLNSWEADFKIIDSPWNLLNHGLKGWSFYPKWKFYGVSPLVQYFKQPVVLMNVSNYYNEWKYGFEWNESRKEESDWMLWLAGTLNARYFLYHIDVPATFISQTESKILRYVERGDLSPLMSNQFFRFYKLSDKYALPHIYVPNKFYHVKEWDLIPIALESPPNDARIAIFNEAASYRELRPINSAPILEYKKINPAKYIIRLHNVKSSFPIIFSESHNINWQLYPRSYEKKQTDFTSSLQPFETSESNSANSSDIEIYIRNKWISDLGDGKDKTRATKTWVSFNKQVLSKKNYRLDYVSRMTKGTIQNNNLPDGNFYDTWTISPIDDTYHRLVNGYANYWFIDLPYLLKFYPDVLKKSDDGGYDFEIIIEFWPQKLLYISKLYIASFFIIIFS